MRSSIIIVSYNGMSYLERCLSSLSFEIEHDEVIIVDNGSADGSVEFIRAHPMHPALLINQANRGFAAACNQGAEVASGDYLVFLNQDTCVDPGWLSGLVSVFNDRPDVGLTTSKLLLMSQPGRIQMCGQDVHFSGLVFGRGFLSPSMSNSEPAIVGAVSGASFAVRRSLWRQLGGFDERLYMYYEETDLSWRALKAGFLSLYTPASTVYHDYIPSHPVYSTLYYSMRNRCILVWKNWQLSAILLLSPSLLLIEILEWFHAVSIGRIGALAKLRAAAWCLGHLPELYKYNRKAGTAGYRSGADLLAGCVSHIKQVEYKSGLLGRIMVSISNPLFSLNALITKRILQFLVH